MICENTFDTGFYFWLGKLAAEVAWGIGFLWLFIGTMMLFEYYQRKVNKHG